MSVRPIRLIFDITDMVRFAHENWQVTGISRVSLTLASQAAALRPDMVKVGYFDAVTRTYRTLQDVALLASPDLLRSHLRRAVGHVKQLKVWKHRRGTFRYGYHRFNRELALTAERLKKLICYRSFVDPELKFQPGDRLICLGAGWSALDAFAHASGSDWKAGSSPEIVMLVHDLIPLIMPSMPGTVDERLFVHWLQRMMEMNATFLFYSSSTEKDFGAWCQGQGVPSIFARRFRLADELISFSGGTIRDEVRQLEHKDYMLCVGSIMGRKNGKTLIQALRLLQARYPGKPFPTLVLGGSTTRGDLETLLRGGTGEEDIILIDKPNDVELSFLYRHCRFTVFPSLYEGWGLPIGESLWHGKLCATSNCSSMPEVGGDACEYFDAKSFVDIARALETLIFDSRYLADRTSAIRRERLVTWRRSAELLLDALCRTSAVLHPPRDTSHAAPTISSDKQ